MEMMQRPGADTIVVGVDASPSGHLALQWAVDEARRRGLRLHLVRVVQEGVGAVSMVGGEALVGEAQADREALAQLAATVGGGIEVTTEVRIGPAGSALVEAATHAAMLVVGPRRHGALGSALLGSVSTYCTHHGHCPVVVVARVTSPA